MRGGLRRWVPAQMPGEGVVLWRPRCRGVVDTVTVRLQSSIPLGLAAALSLGLALVSAARTRVMEDELAIWADTIAKRPGNARAHASHGLLLSQRGRPAEAAAARRTWVCSSSIGVATAPGSTAASMAWPAGARFLRRRLLSCSAACRWRRWIARAS